MPGVGQNDIRYSFVAPKVLIKEGKDDHLLLN